MAVSDVATTISGGTLEDSVSDAAILRRAALEPGDGDPAVAARSIETVVAAAAAGDLRMRSILADAGTALGEALANLVAVLAPPRIIVSGHGLRAGDLLTEPMRQAFARHISPAMHGCCSNPTSPTNV